ncbi:MAG: dimethyl sulfoxide reductase anchor subunit [Actinomycetota bacterium]|nr:dimethyl sulfoxide reductase anchor subunit [Actinomycetota bacterium]
MRPERSLILLLVLAGVGQGIFVFLAVADIAWGSYGWARPEVIYWLGVSSLAFAFAGMAASLFHLGNPMRGWKAIIRWQSSWLSREAVSMGLFSGAAALYLLLYFFSAPSGLRTLVGLAGIFAAFALYISSAMLYARISFVREWSNKLTAINFMAFGLASGVAVSYAVLCLLGFNYTAVREIAAVLAAVGLILKAASLAFNKTVYVPLDIKNALVMNEPNIKLMSTGTSYEHYNTKEYSSGFTDAQVRSVLILSLFAAFVLPLIIWAVMTQWPDTPAAGILASLAALSMIAGLIAERGLFFIQGNHLQNLYYATFRSNSASNPLLSKAKKGTPAPVK